MKLTLLTAVLALSATVAHAKLPDLKTCAHKDEVLTQQVAAARSRFEIGEGTRTDVAMAEFALSQNQVACAETTRTQYCATAVANVQLYRDGIVEEAGVGQRTQAEVTAAEDMLWDVKDECGVN